MTARWQDRAECQAENPALFDEGALGDLDRQLEALRVCRECGVTQECGEWAARDRYTGVAGGQVFWLGRVLSEQGRRMRIRKRRDVA